MSPERRLRAGEAQWAIQAMARGILTVGVILGALIILGGESRWSSPSFREALTYPYAPESWGWVLGVASLVGLVGSVIGRLKYVTGALFIIAVWSFFFAFSFWKTALDIPTAGTTGIPVYLGLAVACILLGIVHWRSAQDAVHR